MAVTVIVMLVVVQGSGGNYVYKNSDCGESEGDGDWRE